VDGGAVKPLDLRRVATAPIRNYDSVRAASARLADGAGEAHVHLVRFEPGGAIGRHEAGFGQLFLVLEGSGWVEGGDGRRVELAAGQGAWIARGEQHAKGSEAGMTALMLQVRDLDPG
jgi:quercetin dioxygenase-like cupin family protein